jgi:hypothetical protein
VWRFRLSAAHATGTPCQILFRGSRAAAPGLLGASGAAGVVVVFSGSTVGALFLQGAQPLAGLVRARVRGPPPVRRGLMAQPPAHRRVRDARTAAGVGPSQEQNNARRESDAGNEPLSTSRARARLAAGRSVLSCLQTREVRRHLSATP